MPFVGIGVGIGRQRFAQGGIFAAYAARVAADGGVTEAGACVNAVSGISLNSSLLLVPSGYKSGVVYSEIPTDGDGDLTFTRASDATRVNSDGEIEVVGSGVPRLDYSQGSCPALLLEPQRTNLVTYSEEFDNASWVKANATVTANTTTAPDGNNTADTINLTSVPDSRVVKASLSIANSTAYTFSCYFKNISLVSGETFNFRINNLLAAPNNFLVIAQIDLFNGTVTYAQSGNAITGISGFGNASIQSLENGWYRVNCSFTSGNSATTTNAQIQIISSVARSFYAWGAQFEVGAYATSYIPTTSATVTRLADACSKTGISSLIGQTEGTMFVEVDTAVLGDVFSGLANRRFLTISDNSLNNRILIQQKRDDDAINFVVINSNVVQADISTSSNQSGIKKIAVGYANNDFVMYVNGVQIGTDTSGSVPICSRVGVGSFETSANTSNAACPVYQVSLFTTRLSNAELASLTTL